MVCVTFLKLLLVSSFKSSARMIGAGKLKSRHSTFSRMVLTIARENSLMENSLLKFFIPLHGLAAMPLKML